MKKSDFYFELPPELIAQHPLAERRASRLLVVKANEVAHRTFADFIDLVKPGDLLVFNNTKVIPARWFGHKSSGGKIEILIERVINQHEILAHVRASKAPKADGVLLMDGGAELQVVGRTNDLYHLRCLGDKPILTWIDQYGHMPLPPYIHREDAVQDKERYQTVYAQQQGAVAAPTAGLHFDDEMLAALRKKGVNIAFVTLHVGAGTFQPVRVDDIREHHMHSEYMEVSESVCEQVRQTKREGGRVIAIGTTSVRCLETAAKNGEIEIYSGDTNIFIYPGYEFRCVDAMITNFHLPESTLLMLVSAFAGYDRIRAAYEAAIQQKYRFFSYGDAMFLERTFDVV